jgi:uncharacterized membrane protein YkvA (DUF1232 family)
MLMTSEWGTAMADKGVVAELYSDEMFWEKLGKHGAQAGSQLVHKTLVLYYTMKDPKTPNRIKASIMGALAYFILPLDALPDAIVGVGYLDDLGVLTWAYDTTFNHISEGVLKDASRAWKRLLGSAGAVGGAETECTTPSS